jgi:hypothetical protein
VRARLLWLAALVSACGGPAGQTLDDCMARYARGPRTTFMPVCVATARGAMLVEQEYVPGVVECELGGAVDAPAALEAQAIAARTFLAVFLDRRGEDAEVPTTSRFQCWKSGAGPAAIAATRRTADVVMHHEGALISANYAAGTRRLGADCAPRPPADSGYDFESWAAMRADFEAALNDGHWPRYGGTDWTEVLVTRNAGLQGDKVVQSPLAGRASANRGALGQNAAHCLARAAGYDTQSILRYFYGDDVHLSAPLPPSEQSVLPVASTSPPETGTPSARDGSRGGP